MDRWFFMLNRPWRVGDKGIHRGVAEFPGKSSRQSNIARWQGKLTTGLT